MQCYYVQWHCFHRHFHQFHLNPRNIQSTYSCTFSLTTSFSTSGSRRSGESLKMIWKIQILPQHREVLWHMLPSTVTGKWRGKKKSIFWYKSVPRPPSLRYILDSNCHIFWSHTIFSTKKLSPQLRCEQCYAAFLFMFKSKGGGSDMQKTFRISTSINFALETLAQNNPWNAKN